MVYDIVGGYAFGFGVVVADYAVPQHFVGHSLHVFDVGGVLAVECRVGACSDDEVLRGTGTGSPGYIFLGIFVPVFSACGCYQSHRIFAHVVDHGHPAYGFLAVHYLFGVEHLLGFLAASDGGLFYYPHLFVKTGVVEPYVEHKTVQLGFG